MTTTNLFIDAQPTPNPNTLRFGVNQLLLREGTANFPTRESARGSLLAERLFTIDTVTAVFVGTNFITVTKTPAADWNTLVAPVTETIRVTLAEGGTFVAATTINSQPTGESDDQEIERQIREVLDREIRPAVAMDGGDITFYGYKDGIVTLHLQGACSSCPSSIMTLKMGVENRLRMLIPQVKEVVQINSFEHPPHVVE